MIISPNFIFNKKCEQALKLYEKAFNGKITSLFYYKDADPSDFPITLSEKEKGYVYHAEMMIGNQRLMFSDSLEQIPSGTNLSLVMVYELKEDVEKAYEILIDRGHAITPPIETTYSSCFTCLVDEFGIRWTLMTEKDS